MKQRNQYADESSERTSVRETWEFIYPAQEVATAAEKQAKHHRSRQAWWEKEAKVAETELKKKGFEYRERARTLGADIEIVGDPELAKRVTVAKQKVEEHSRQVRLYETWTRALKAVVRRGKSKELKLTIDDVLFFAT